MAVLCAAALSLAVLAAAACGGPIPSAEFAPYAAAYNWQPITDMLNSQIASKSFPGLVSSQDRQCTPSRVAARRLRCGHW